MRQKTILATLVTLTFLVGSVFTTIVAMAAAAQFDLPIALAISVGATCLWSLVMWLISPLIMDLVQRWVYKAMPVTLEDLGRERPAIAAFVSQVCQKHGIPVPRLKLIDDQTPQAYCYGSHAGNARLVVTRGILHYLDDEEAKAVYAHELGHIVHRDFIVMTLAATLLQILWNVYIVCKNVRGKNNSRPLAPIGLVALVFYWVGQYVLLFLSRTREYYADAFSAEETGNPNALSLALIKIAYGLTRETPTPLSVKLMGGTRALGISDPKSAGSAGLAYRMTGDAAAIDRPSPGYPGAAAAAAMAVPAVMDSVRRIEKVLLFDLYNPWATVLEIGSTHPLTGKRIRALGEQSVAAGRAPLLSFERVDASGRALDMSRMYSAFLFEVAVYFLPFIVGALSLMLVIGLALLGTGIAGPGVGIVVGGIGLGMTIKGFYRFAPLGEPQAATVLELMSDPYASPLRGRPVRVAGTIIGRADAGNRVSEDFTLEDPGGGLMPINYESPLGFLGNWWFAIRRVGGLIGRRVEAVGWFRRGITHQVDLERMRTEGAGDVSSYTAFWGKLGGVAVMLIGVGLAVFFWLAGGT